MAASNEFQRSRNDGPMVFAGAAGAFPTLDLGVGVEAAAGEASAFGLFAPAPLPADGGEAVCGARFARRHTHSAALHITLGQRPTQKVAAHVQRGATKH